MNREIFLRSRDLAYGPWEIYSASTFKKAFFVLEKYKFLTKARYPSMYNFFWKLIVFKDPVPSSFSATNFDKKPTPSSSLMSSKRVDIDDGL